jgi:glutamyl-tRNA synthetase
MPTYHLANIVDDHLMKISHVIRGEEWLPSAPMHIMLYEAFKWEAPIFAHLPLLLRPDGNGKLSKRDGDRLGFPVFPCNWTTKEGELYSGYKEKGYLPQAFINMLVMLGWNPGTPQEIFTLKELEEIFSLDRVSKAGAKFDPEKTKWFEQQHLSLIPDKDLAQQLINDYDVKIEIEKLTKVVNLMKERAIFPVDILEEGEYLLNRPKIYDEQTVNKKWNENSVILMNDWLKYIELLPDFSPISIENAFKSFISDKNLGIGAVLPLFRLLLTGRSSGPSMFEIASFFGKDETIERIKLGILKLNEN